MEGNDANEKEWKVYDMSGDSNKKSMSEMLGVTRKGGLSVDGEDTDGKKRIKFRLTPRKIDNIISFLKVAFGVTLAIGAVLVPYTMLTYEPPTHIMIDNSTFFMRCVSIAIAFAGLGIFFHGIKIVEVNL